MSDNLKEEYLSVLEKIDSLMQLFYKMEEKTAKLKERFAYNPDEEGLIDEIKEHEENYKKVYEQMLKLNNRASELKDKYSK